jgi:hypothetical protein
VQLPQKSDLPFKSPDTHLVIDDNKLAEFHRAFRDKLTYTPPTLMAVSMRGIFNLLDHFQTDWKKLLHATQSFTYHTELQVPAELKSTTALIDVKFRAAHHWLTFETSIADARTGALVISSKSLLMVREDG